jgi:hypothetical protein
MIYVPNLLSVNPSDIYHVHGYQIKAIHPTEEPDEVMVVFEDGEEAIYTIDGRPIPDCPQVFMFK